MTHPVPPLPADLGEAFSVADARAHGIARSRLDGRDLTAPFHGVRQRLSDNPAEAENAYEQQRRTRVALASAYAPRLHRDHVFSHHTAASLWGAPLPLEFDADQIADRPTLHVSAVGAMALPRVRGVTRHRARADMTAVRLLDGMPVTSPATTWAMLGELSVPDLVALGDYFCRRWRDGVGRKDAGREPLATLAELEAAMRAGRRRGIPHLREALPLVREDSWSPRESALRFALVAGGLPEPALNVDVFDESGRFLACVDQAYVDRRVAIEYHGQHHSEQWAHDVDRADRLRASGWVVIEVTSALLSQPGELLRRVRRALRER